MTFSKPTYNTTNPIDTKIAISFYDLGRTYEQRNRFDLAVENYNKSLEYDPNLQFVKMNLNKIVKKFNLKKISSAILTNTDKLNIMSLV